MRLTEATKAKLKGNPFHGRDGRFTSANSDEAVSSFYFRNRGKNSKRAKVDGGAGKNLFDSGNRKFINRKCGRSDIYTLCWTQAKNPKFKNEAGKVLKSTAEETMGNLDYIKSLIEDASSIDVTNASLLEFNDAHGRSGRFVNKGERRGKVHVRSSFKGRSKCASKGKCKTIEVDCGRSDRSVLCWNA